MRIILLQYSFLQKTGHYLDLGKALTNKKDLWQPFSLNVINMNISMKFHEAIKWDSQVIAKFSRLVIIKWADEETHTGVYSAHSGNRPSVDRLRSAFGL